MRKEKCKHCNWAYSIGCLDRDEDDECEFEPAYELEDEPVSGDAVTRAMEIIGEFCKEKFPNCDQCFIKAWCYGMENKAPRDLEVPEL